MQRIHPPKQKETSLWTKIRNWFLSFFSSKKRHTPNEIPTRPEITTSQQKMLIDISNRIHISVMPHTGSSTFISLHEIDLFSLHFTLAGCEKQVWQYATDSTVFFQVQDESYLYLPQRCICTTTKGASPDEKLLVSIRGYKWPTDQDSPSQEHWFDSISDLFQKEYSRSESEPQKYLSFEERSSYEELIPMLIEHFQTFPIFASAFVWFDFILSYSGRGPLQNEIGRSCLSLNRLPQEFQSKINGQLALTDHVQDKVAYVYKKMPIEGMHDGYIYQISRISIVLQQNVICRYECIWEHIQEGTALS